MTDHVNGNELLARISWADYPDLLSRLKPVPLEQGLVLYEARAPIEYVYFPTSGALSSVVVMSDGSMIEVATVGREGAVGLPTFGVTGSSPNKVFVQVPGEALRIEVALFQKRVENDEPLRKLLLKYQEAFIVQVSQSVACNGLHAVPERCCRWLLMTHDCVDGHEILLTHEFMSVMLGVRRPSVTEVLRGLKERGLISYTRGKITVLDRQGLEEGSCECYRVVRDEYARLLD
ncbi:MAG: Crp/Fnr family transcriptional regulator [Pirellulaceae bacterium]